MDSLSATAQYFQEEQWRAGNYFYPVTDGNENPFLEKTLTPGYLVSTMGEYISTSGQRCLEGAHELGEMCESMFTATMIEALRGPSVAGSTDGGFFGMTQSQNGLASYVSQMVQEASQAVVGEAVNVALANLINVRQVEVAFLQAKESSAGLLASAVNKLRTTEKTCWELIAFNDKGQDKHVCTAQPTGKTCTAVAGGSITIATSTQFSDAVINASIKDLGIAVAQDAQKSQQALATIDSLIAQVTNAASAANQRAALSQLDQMIAANVRLPDCAPQKTLHTAGDVACATKQRDDIAAAINILVEDTIRNWGDITRSNSADTAWCDINSPAVITKWTTAWKK
jgi:hypothetical protein